MAQRRKPYHGPTDLADRRVTVYRGRGVKVEFQMHRSTIRRMAVGDELREACRSVVVHRALPFAIQNSPRSRVNDGSGDLPYVASWRVTEGQVTLVGMRRVSVKLVNIAPHAAAVEFINPKTGKGHGYGVLSKTLAHLHGESTAGEPPKRKRDFNPEQHPRGARGRFVSKRPTTESEFVDEGKRRQQEAQARYDERARTAYPDGADPAAQAYEEEAAIANAVYDAARRRRRRR